jgi:hypothetical protein
MNTSQDIKYDPEQKAYVGKCRECHGLKSHPLAYLNGIHGVRHLILKHPQQLKTKISYKTIFIPFQSGLEIPTEQSKELQKEVDRSKRLSLF